ncbi:ElyC/SanA/YdcF family protein [Microbacterium sp. B19]|uniref:ElyC/SanA/YdcF family protein n=1 Tax=Microbacterium sp. B19 TaxID=96765 RepID=UPI001651A555|nr:ElyC/SanA/YdcF family protein [Microbacterium sp. B19]
MLLVPIIAGLPVYVWPPQSPPEEADYALVLGPPNPPRVHAAERLLRQGLIGEVVLSVSPDGPESAAQYPACQDDRARCLVPDPFTTKGEARLAETLAVGAEEPRIIVVTFTPQVARARYIFDRCYGGQVQVIGVDENLGLWDWAYQYAYQTTAFVKAWMTPCA